MLRQSPPQMSPYIEVVPRTSSSYDQSNVDSTAINIRDSEAETVTNANDRMISSFPAGYLSEEQEVYRMRRLSTSTTDHHLPTSRLINPSAPGGSTEPNAAKLNLKNHPIRETQGSTSAIADPTPLPTTQRNDAPTRLSQLASATDRVNLVPTTSRQNLSVSTTSTISKPSSSDLIGYLTHPEAAEVTSTATPPIGHADMGAEVDPPFSERVDLGSPQLGADSHTHPRYLPEELHNLLTELFGLAGGSEFQERYNKVTTIYYRDSPALWYHRVQEALGEGASASKALKEMRRLKSESFN
ncbi:hypothetical protein CALCODRAFT_509023 [Calocera cornea HHB12733]|uniref:Uncharacterized protein n=1 Tax=Calocera cornea HHB12733 TaxID=1353952 RepID=A0A165FQ09_9BASI|nr:hypothetical protein CALCODRAFT_509023 [Calocera cornea HHB12733]